MNSPEEHPKAVAVVVPYFREKTVELPLRLQFNYSLQIVIYQNFGDLDTV